MLLSIIIFLLSFQQPNWTGSIQGVLTEGDATIKTVHQFSASQLMMKMTFALEDGPSSIEMNMTQSSIQITGKNLNQSYSKSQFKQLQQKPTATVLYATALGQEKTIQGANCQLIEIQTSLGKAIAWVTSDLGDLTSYADYFHDDPITAGITAAGLSGFPVEYQLFGSGGSVIRSFKTTSISN